MNHFIEDMTNVPGVDYDVCYNYPDGEIYYRDDIAYEDCECYFNTYDENHPNYDPNYPGINDDDSCKDKIGCFKVLITMKMIHTDQSGLVLCGVVF